MQLSEAIRDDPKCIRGDRLHLAGHGITCLDRLPSLASQFKTLYLSANFIQSLQHIEQFQHVERISVQGNLLRTPDSVMPLSRLGKLKHLRLSGNPMSEAPCYREEVISLLTSLESLDGHSISAQEREAAVLTIKQFHGLLQNVYNNQLRLYQLQNVKCKVQLHNALLRSIWKGYAPGVTIARQLSLPDPGKTDIGLLCSSHMPQFAECMNQEEADIIKLQLYRQIQNTKKYMLSCLVQSGSRDRKEENPLPTMDTGTQTESNKYTDSSQNNSSHSLNNAPLGEQTACGYKSSLQPAQRMLKRHEDYGRKKPSKPAEQHKTNTSTMKTSAVTDNAGHGWRDQYLAIAFQKIMSQQQWALQQLLNKIEETCEDTYRFLSDLKAKDTQHVWINETNAQINSNAAIPRARGRSTHPKGNQSVRKKQISSQSQSNTRAVCLPDTVYTRQIWKRSGASANDSVQGKVNLPTRRNTYPRRSSSEPHGRQPSRNSSPKQTKISQPKSVIKYDQEGDFVSAENSQRRNSSTDEWDYSSGGLQQLAEENSALRCKLQAFKNANISNHKKAILALSYLQEQNSGLMAENQKIKAEMACSRMTETDNPSYSQLDDNSKTLGGEIERSKTHEVNLEHDDGNKAEHDANIVFRPRYWLGLYKVRRHFLAWHRIAVLEKVRINLENIHLKDIQGGVFSSWKDLYYGRKRLVDRHLAQSRMRRGLIALQNHAAFQEKLRRSTEKQARKTVIQAVRRWKEFPAENVRTKGALEFKRKRSLRMKKHCFSYLKHLTSLLNDREQIIAYALKERKEVLRRQRVFKQWRDAIRDLKADRVNDAAPGDAQYNEQKFNLKRGSTRSSNVLENLYGHENYPETGHYPNEDKTFAILSDLTTAAEYGETKGSQGYVGDNEQCVGKDTDSMNSVDGNHIPIVDWNLSVSSLGEVISDKLGRQAPTQPSVAKPAPAKQNGQQEIETLRSCFPQDIQQKDESHLMKDSVHESSLPRRRKGARQGSEFKRDERRNRSVGKQPMTTGCSSTEVEQNEAIMKQVNRMTNITKTTKGSYTIRGKTKQSDKKETWKMDNGQDGKFETQRKMERARKGSVRGRKKITPSGAVRNVALRKNESTTRKRKNAGKPSVKKTGKLGTGKRNGESSDPIQNLSGNSKVSSKFGHVEKRVPPSTSGRKGPNVLNTSLSTISDGDRGRTGKLPGKCFGHYQGCYTWKDRKQLLQSGIRRKSASAKVYSQDCDSPPAYRNTFWLRTAGSSFFATHQELTPQSQKCAALTEGKPSVDIEQSKRKSRRAGSPFTRFNIDRLRGRHASPEQVWKGNERAISCHQNEIDAMYRKVNQRESAFNETITPLLNSLGVPHETISTPPRSLRHKIFGHRSTKVSENCGTTGEKDEPKITSSTQKNRPRSQASGCSSIKSQNDSKVVQLGKKESIGESKSLVAEDSFEDITRGITTENKRGSGSGFLRNDEKGKSKYVNSDRTTSEDYLDESISDISEDCVEDASVESYTQDAGIRALSEVFQKKVEEDVTIREDNKETFENLEAKRESAIPAYTKSEELRQGSVTPARVDDTKKLRIRPLSVKRKQYSSKGKEQIEKNAGPTVENSFDSSRGLVQSSSEISQNGEGKKVPTIRVSQEELLPSLPQSVRKQQLDRGGNELHRHDKRSKSIGAFNVSSSRRFAGGRRSRSSTSARSRKEATNTEDDSTIHQSDIRQSPTTKHCETSSRKEDSSNRINEEERLRSPQSTTSNVSRGRHRERRPVPSTLSSTGSSRSSSVESHPQRADRSASPSRSSGFSSPLRGIPGVTERDVYYEGADIGVVPQDRQSNQNNDWEEVETIRVSLFPPKSNI